MISLGLVRGEIFQFKQTSEFRGPHSEIRLAKLIKHSAQYVTEREKMVKCNSRLLLRNHAKEKKQDLILRQHDLKSMSREVLAGVAG